MSFEDELSHRLKHLPARPVSVQTIDSVMRRIDQRQLLHRRKLPRVIGIAVATLTPILLVATLISVSPVKPWQLTPSNTARFSILAEPDAMTYTPLDTAAFRHIVQDYLERHSISGEGGSFTVAAHHMSHFLPIINRISEVAIRWSQIRQSKYCAALVTYQGNGHPRIANILAHMDGRGVWQITQMISVPQSATVEAVSKFKVYPGDWGGTGFTPLQNDQVAFEFLSGFVIDPTITKIEIVRSDGYAFSVPMVNGTYGYFTVAGPPRKPFHGYYRVWAYDAKGNVIFHE